MGIFHVERNVQWSIQPGKIETIDICSGFTSFELKNRKMSNVLVHLCGYELEPRTKFKETEII